MPASPTRKPAALDLDGVLVDILGTQEVGSKGKTWTEYRIRVEQRARNRAPQHVFQEVWSALGFSPGSHSWVVTHRYSEFVSLRDGMKNGKSDVPFPNKFYTPGAGILRNRG